MSRKINRELDHTHNNRFADCITLWRRFHDLVEANDNIDRHENFIKAYKRRPYPLKDGGIEPNLGQFQFLIDNEVDRYVDIVTERNHWYAIDTMEGKNEKQESEWSKAITRYFHKYAIKTWEKAAINSLKDIFKMKMFGAGIEYWDNPVDIYPKHKDNSEFFPDATAGMEPDTWDMLFVPEKYTPVELYRLVRSKKSREVSGWNRNAVMEAIRKSCRDEFKGCSSREVFERFRNGEVGETDDIQIHLVDAYVREYNEEGKKQISRYTFVESGEIVEGQDDSSSDSDSPSVSKFLRFNDRLYEEFTNTSALRSDIIVDSFYDKGSYAESIYVYCRFYDKMMNKIIRQGIRRGNIYLKSGNPDEQRRLSEMDHDQEMQVIPPETEFLEVNLRAGDTKTMAEAVRQLKIDTQAGTGSGLVTGSQNVKGRAITAKESEIQSTEAQASSISRHKIFAANDAMLGKEIYRRFIKGGRARDKNQKRFKTKMEEMGIPEEAYDPENVIIKSIINPSAASPTAKLQSAKVIVGALQVYTSASTEGERRAAKSMIASVSGWESVPYFIPEEDSVFEEDQVFKVGRENSDLDDPYVNPKNVTISSDDFHPIHIALHLADMEFKLDVAEQILSEIEAMPNHAKTIQLGKAADILRAQDSKGGHVEAHMQTFIKASNEVGDPLNTVAQSKAKLGEIRQRESILEKQLSSILQSVAEQDPSMNDMEYEHTKRMNTMREQHEERMQTLAVRERITKTMSNSQGAEVNQQQKLQQKAEDHKLDQAIKIDESNRERSEEMAKANSSK